VKKGIASAGFTLVELLISLVIGTILTAGAGAFFIQGSNQYSNLISQNAASQNLIQAAFYLRFYLNQAVKTQCFGVAPFAAIPDPYTLTNVGGGDPVGVGQGVVDCRNGGVAWTPNQYNALAIYNRETGGSSATNGPPYVSVFQGVGIYFLPPVGTSTGVLIFSLAAPGTKTISSASGITISNLVDIQVLPNSISTASNGAIESMTYQLRTRYFLSGGGLQTYLPVPPPGQAPYRDLSLSVQIGFHDNWLGISLDGTGTAQRLDGGIYYFRFSYPSYLMQ
jgi:prepilin-type N-terminal cleavage/methylation domain-containing protein